VNHSSGASHLKYIYRHRDAAAANNTNLSDSQIFDRPTSDDDVVTFDMSGLFNSGNALFGDSGSYGGTFHLAASGSKRAIFLVSHSDGTNRVNVGNSNALIGEAIIMDIALGAAWGYKALNDNAAEDYSFTTSGLDNNTLRGEASTFTFFPTDDWTTRFFVTPIGNNMDSANISATVAVDNKASLIASGPAFTETAYGICDRDSTCTEGGSTVTVTGLGAINIDDFLDATQETAVENTGGYGLFIQSIDAGLQDVIVYKLEFVLSDPTYGGTNNSTYCLSCEPDI
jgi:hypothetical protein